MNNVIISACVGLVCCHIATYFCHNTIKEYEKDLTSELQDKYDAIKIERMLHFVIGLLISLVITIIYNIKNTEIPIQTKIIHSIFLNLLIPIVIYRILPKTDYMLLHTQTSDDVKDWFNIYQCMQNKCTHGFFTGFSLSIIMLSMI